MTVLNIQPIEIGQVGVLPRSLKMVTSDNYATITGSGYLDKNSVPGGLTQSDVIEVLYSFNGVTGTFGIFQPLITDGVVQLVGWVNPAAVNTPVVSGDFAIFNGLTGKIGDAGYSPSDVTKTKVVMANAATVVNNIALFADVAGTVKDAGYRIISGTTAVYGGGGTSNAFTVTGLTVNSKGSAVIRASTNAVSIAKALPGTDSLTITFSADPGASTTVDYIYTTVAVS